jgi:hypothetical protein
MVDPTAYKVLSGYHRSGVAISIRGCVGGRRLVEAVARLGTSTGEVFSLIAIEAAPICRVPHWHLKQLHIQNSRGSSLGSVGALYKLTLRSLVALHCSLGSLLELSSELLGSTLDRSDRWHTYLGPGVVATLTLALLLPLVFNDTTMRFFSTNALFTMS